MRSSLVESVISTSRGDKPVSVASIKQALTEAAMATEPSYDSAKKPGSKDESGDLKKNYIQWVQNGNSFSPAGKIVLAPKLHEFAYRVSQSMSGPVFTKTRARTDELYNFKSSVMESICDEIDKFWGLKENFSKLGFLHNRGIMIYGPPGTGKSSLTQQIAEMMIKRGDVIFFAKGLGALLEGLRAFREIEPERKLVVVLEDLDEYIQYSERDLLQLLDGEDAVDNVLYIGSTNYIDRFPPRLIRPGRFDKTIYLGPPPYEGRLVYLQHKLKNTISEQELADLAKKTDGFSFGHLRELVIAAYALKEPLAEVIKRLSKRENIKESDGKPGPTVRRQLTESADPVKHREIGKMTESAAKKSLVQRVMG